MTCRTTHATNTYTLLCVACVCDAACVRPSRWIEFSLCCFQFVFLFFVFSSLFFFSSSPSPLPLHSTSPATDGTDTTIAHTQRRSDSTPQHSTRLHYTALDSSLRIVPFRPHFSSSLTPRRPSSPPHGALSVRLAVRTAVARAVPVRVAAAQCDGQRSDE